MDLIKAVKRNSIYNKLKWITKMLETTYNSPWKSYLNTKFKPNINEVPFHNLTENNYPSFNDKFYSEIFNMWAYIHYYISKNMKIYVDKSYGTKIIYSTKTIILYIKIMGK